MEKLLYTCVWGWKNCSKVVLLAISRKLKLWAVPRTHCRRNQKHMLSLLLFLETSMWFKPWCPFCARSYSYSTGSGCFGRTKQTAFSGNGWSICYQGTEQGNWIVVFTNMIEERTRLNNFLASSMAKPCKRHLIASISATKHWWLHSLWHCSYQ